MILAYSKPWRRVDAWVISCLCHGVKENLRACPKPSTTIWILVVNPPLLRPKHSRAFWFYVILFHGNAPFSQSNVTAFFIQFLDKCTQPSLFKSLFFILHFPSLWEKHLKSKKKTFAVKRTEKTTPSLSTLSEYLSIPFLKQNLPPPYFLSVYIAKISLKKRLFQSLKEIF